MCVSVCVCVCVGVGGWGRGGLYIQHPERRGVSRKHNFEGDIYKYKLGRNGLKCKGILTYLFCNSFRTNALIIYPVNIHRFKLNNRNTKKRYEIYLKLTIKTIERLQ